MAQNIWYDNFLELLFSRYAKRTELTEALMDLLHLEREAVYRRLRKDVVFTANEIAKIAMSWQISFDDIIVKSSNEMAFRGRMLDYLNPSEEDLDAIHTVVQMLEHIKDFPDLEYMEISNRLSRMLTTGFEYLTRFYLLKWKYQYANGDTPTFSQIICLEEVKNFSSDFYKMSKNLSNINFVWDNRIFSYLADDIRCFHSIYMITDEEKELIKSDLYALIDYMSEVASKGCWLETGNKVNLYISQVNIDTNYHYYYYDSKVQLCGINIFGKNIIYSTNSAMLEDFRTFMQSKKKSSVQISEANERNRIEFFMKQRQLIDSL